MLAFDNYLRHVAGRLAHGLVMRDDGDMMPMHQAAAAVLVRDQCGSVLMVATAYRDALVLPGGIIERDESPAAAAAREVREETGLVIAPTRLLVVQHLPAGEDGGSGLRFVFDADPVAKDIPVTPQPDEVTELPWLTPAAAVARHTGRGRRRLQLALRAQATSACFYLDGACVLPAELDASAQTGQGPLPMT